MLVVEDDVGLESPRGQGIRPYPVIASVLLKRATPVLGFKN
jgi:hypothetical protein